MKQTHNTTANLLNQFDKELRAILNYDLKVFLAGKGKFLKNNPGRNRGGLQVA